MIKAILREQLTVEGTSIVGGEFSPRALRGAAARATAQHSGAATLGRKSSTAFPQLHRRPAVATVVLDTCVCVGTCVQREREPVISYARGSSTSLDVNSAKEPVGASTPNSTDSQTHDRAAQSITSDRLLLSSAVAVEKNRERERGRKKSESIRGS